MLSSKQIAFSKNSYTSRSFVIQMVAHAMMETVFSAVALIPILLFFKVNISIKMMQIFPVIVLTVIQVVGFSKVLAVAYVFFADIDYLYAVFMTLMMFISGVFIPLNHVPSKIQGILSVNPVYLSIDATRKCIMYDSYISLVEWSFIIGWTLFFSIVGTFIFLKFKERIINKL